MGPAFPVNSCKECPLPRMLQDKSAGDVNVKLDAYPAQKSVFTIEMNSNIDKVMSLRSKTSVSYDLSAGAVVVLGFKKHCDWTPDIKRIPRTELTRLSEPIFQLSQASHTGPVCKLDLKCKHPINGGP